jgi:hypothetical protein
MACASSRSDRHLGDWLGSIDSQVGVVSVQQGARVTEPSEKKASTAHSAHIAVDHAAGTCRGLGLGGLASYCLQVSKLCWACTGLAVCIALQVVAGSVLFAGAGIGGCARSAQLATRRARYIVSTEHVSRF